MMKPPKVRNFRGLHHAFRLLRLEPDNTSQGAGRLVAAYLFTYGVRFHWFRVFRRHYDVCERHYLCHVGAGQGQAVSGKLRTIVA